METTERDEGQETTPDEQESGSAGEGAPGEGGSAESEAAEQQAEHLRGG